MLEISDRRYSRYTRAIGLGVAILIVVAVAGCGGGSGSSGAGSLTPPPSSSVSVTVSPASATVGYGSTQQFAATVTGSTNTAVTWSVAGASGANDNQTGSISSSGLYTAPPATTLPAEATPQAISVTGGNTTSSVNISVAPLNSAGSVTVTATSQADSSKSASATVTLSGLSIIGVGQCSPSISNPNQLSCQASSTGTSISRSQSAGQTTYLFVAGYGILPGTIYSVSGNDVVVTQPTSAGGNFVTLNDGTPAVYFPVVVPSTAGLGPRNLTVRNPGNELASFAGAVLITQ